MTLLCCSLSSRSHYCAAGSKWQQAHAKRSSPSMQSMCRPLRTDAATRAQGETLVLLHRGRGSTEHSQKLRQETLAQEEAEITVDPTTTITMTISLAVSRFGV